MKCVILAAGEGSRLFPITENRPKPMLTIGGIPIINRVIECLRKNKIKELIMIIGHKKEIIQDYLKDGSSFGVNIEYVVQPNFLGTANALNLTKDYFKGDDFLEIYGDLFIRPKTITKVLEEYHRTGEFVVGITSVKNPENYGLVKTKGHYITRIDEKPKANTKSDNQINAGIYVFKNEIFDAIKPTKKSSRGEFEITDSINQLIKNGEKIRTVLLNNEEWMDIGNPWDLLEANKRSLDETKHKINGDIEKDSKIIGPVTIQKGARILSGVRIEGPIFIGENSNIGPNCYIRPYTSIGRDVKIGNACEIKNSIIMNETKIPHLSYVGDSIIGSGCNLGAGTITGNLRLDEKTVKMRIKNKTVDSGRRKLGVIIGDHVSTAINVNFMPGVKVGSRSLIGPNVIIYQDIPSGTKIISKQEISEMKL